MYQQGFSITELMVVIVILGILTAVAIPRYNIFVARGNQAEAKTGLSLIYKLQESHKLRYGAYAKANNTSNAMNTPTTSYGYILDTASTDATRYSCDANSLGFSMKKPCKELNYRFWVVGADENEFIAVATGFSDGNNETYKTKHRIFPNCDGQLTGSPAPKRNITQGTLSNDVSDGWVSIGGAGTLAPAAGVNRGDIDTGDAWFIDQSRNLINYKDIVDACTD